MQSRSIGFYVVHWLVSSLVATTVCVIAFRGYGERIADEAIASRNAIEAEAAELRAALASCSERESALSQRVDEFRADREALFALDQQLLEDMDAAVAAGASDLEAMMLYLTGRVAASDGDDEELVAQVAEAIRSKFGLGAAASVESP